MMPVGRLIDKRNAKGIFMNYPAIKKSDISDFASIGFVTYFLYPVPVYHRKREKIKICDYIICREYQKGSTRALLREYGLSEDFKTVSENDDYIIKKRFRKVKQR
jgi:hypothetical protein